MINIFHFKYLHKALLMDMLYNIIHHINNINYNIFDINFYSNMNCIFLDILHKHYCLRLSKKGMLINNLIYINMQLVDMNCSNDQYTNTFNLNRSLHIHESIHCIKLGKNCCKAHQLNKSYFHILNIRYDCKLNSYQNSYNKLDYNHMFRQDNQKHIFVKM